MYFADAPIMNFLCKVDKVIVMSVDTRKIYLLFIYVRLRDSLYDNVFRRFALCGHRVSFAS